MYTENKSKATKSDDTILKSFGGTIRNDLNEILENPQVNEDLSNFKLSSYFDLDSISEAILPNDQKFKVLSINIQSINAKFDSLTSFLQLLSDKNIIFDSVLLQETWLTQSQVSDPKNIALYQIPGYNLIPQGKICCGHGGLFTYVRDIYKCSSPRPLYHNSNVYEALYIDVTCENIQPKITIGNVY